MYNSIYELPSQVRASLDEHDLGVFLKTYNDCNPTTKEEVKSAMIKAWEACKTLPSSFSFCITASVEVIDRQKEVIDMDSIIRKMDSFLDYGGNIQDEHGDYHVATIWKWEPAEVQGHPAVNVWGNVFGGDKVYDKTRQDFVNGKNSLSIAGEADMGKYQCDEKGCYVRRSVEQLMEISLCAIPCNPMATLVWYNKGAKLTKSFENSINLCVEQYTVHKDAQFCPVQAVKKSLLAVGIEAHAKEYGVEVGAENEARIAKSKTLGYVKKGDKLIVQSKKRMGEKAYSNCLRKGYITEEGIVKNRMPKKVFKALSDKGMLRNGGGFYALQKYWGDDDESRYIAVLIGSKIEMFNDGMEAVQWARENKTDGEEVIMANIGESEMISFEGEADEFRSFITENPEYRVEHLESLTKSLKKVAVPLDDMKEIIRRMARSEDDDFVEIIRHNERRQLIVMDVFNNAKWVIQFYNEIPTFNKLIDLLETGRFVDIDYIDKEDY